MTISTMTSSFDRAVALLGATAHAGGSVFSATDDGDLHLLPRAEIERLASLLERGVDEHDAFMAWGGSMTGDEQVLVLRVDDGDHDGTVDASIVAIVDGEVIEGAVTLAPDRGRPTFRGHHPLGTCGSPLDYWASSDLARAIADADDTGVIGLITYAVDQAWDARVALAA